MHTQGILQAEFLNPAYNSFKDYVSLGFYNRMQWGSAFKYSPETYVANLFLPVRKTRLGVSLGFIMEDLGLRQTTEFKLSACYNIRLSGDKLLAFGYSVGFLQNSLDQDKIISYPDEDLSFLLLQEELNSTYPTTSVGLMFLTPRWFLSLSSMTIGFKKEMDDSQYFPGFDFSGGSLFVLSPWLKLRPGFIMKYYNEKGIKYASGISNKYKVPTIYDVSANFLISERVWLGTSHRFNQAHTFSTDLLIVNSLKLGYTFELGIGEGLNQFNSHGLRLSYSFGHKRAAGNTLDIWPDNFQDNELSQNTPALIY